MIEQGTDGLSRGLWHATERRHEGINQVLFEAVPYTPSLGIWAGNLLGYQGTWPCYMPATALLDMSGITGRLTVWNPPPECARQVITCYLRRWVQTPTTSCAIFIIPRILQKRWGRIARYVEEVGVFQSNQLPPDCRFESHLPFVLLHVPIHRHVLRRDRMELPAKAQPQGWHKRQAEEVRRLS